MSRTAQDLAATFTAFSASSALADISTGCGATSNGLRVVTSGLKAGERVVVNGLQRVRPGVVVQPQQVTMEAKA